MSLQTTSSILAHTFVFRRHFARRQQPADINKQKQRNHQSLYETGDPPFLEMAPPHTTCRFVFSTLITCRYKQPIPFLLIPLCFVANLLAASSLQILTTKSNEITNHCMKRGTRHFWRWLLHTPLAVSSSPRSSHVAGNSQLLLTVFEFLHHSSRRHSPADINKHKQQNQQSFELARASSCYGAVSFGY